MANRWRILTARGLLLGAVLTASLGVTSSPAAALSLNPLDYYEYDYYIALSHSEVEPGESFSVTAGATVRCTKDLPFGVRQAAVRFKVLARHGSSGAEMTLLESYELTVSNVPDWAGDEYSTTETVSLAFPSGTPPGTYTLSARLEYLSLDGWNVTGMVPSSARTMGLGSIVCAVPDETPLPPEPDPAPQPGVLIVSVLGHQSRPAINSDGVLLDTIDASLIEGLLSVNAQAGTRCVNESGSPLTFITASQELSPRAHAGGAVLSAFALRPDGARFSPPLRIGIAYNIDELPPGTSEDDLSIGYYDRSDGKWHQLPSSVDTSRKTVSADISHFSVFGLLAPTPAPGPARFAVRNLDVSPAQIAPFGRVDVSVTVSNTGDTADVYPLIVSVDGQREHTETINLGPRQSRTVRLTVSRSQPGVYQVRVENLTMSFAVIGGGTAGTPPTGSPTQPPPATTPGQSAPPGSATGDSGMHPVYVVLLVLAGIAFLTLVILVLAGAL